MRDLTIILVSLVVMAYAWAPMSTDAWWAFGAIALMFVAMAVDRPEGKH